MAEVPYSQDLDIPSFSVFYNNNNILIIRPGVIWHAGSSASKFARPALITRDGVVKKYIVPVNGSSTSATISPIGNGDFSDFYDLYKDYFNNIPDPSDLSCVDGASDYYTYIIPVESDANWNSNSTTFNIYPRDAEFMCVSDLQSLSPLFTATNIASLFVNRITYKAEGTVEVEDSGSSSIDTSGLENSIILIPATLLTLAFFWCIYKIFINRRLRG